MQLAKPREINISQKFWVCHFADITVLSINALLFLLLPTFGVTKQYWLESRTILFHYSNSGPLSWSEALQSIVRIIIIIQITGQKRTGTYDGT